VGLEEGDKVDRAPEAVARLDAVGGLEAEREGEGVGDEVPLPKAGEGVETLRVGVAYMPVPVGLPVRVMARAVPLGLERVVRGDEVDESEPKDDPVGLLGVSVPKGVPVDTPPSEEVTVGESLPPKGVSVGEELGVTVAFQGVRLGLAVGA